jgi:2-deoxy-D-gluconate 3-dehydrogenase
MTVIDTFRMTGSTAVVTGAAGGLGQAFAEAIAEAGGNVVLADINADGVEAAAAEIAAETGAETHPIEVDVTDEAAVKAMIDEAIDRFGRIDAAFANAGIAPPEKSLDEYEMEDWYRVIDINLTGVWLTDLHAARVMAEQEGGGSIINTASVYGLSGLDTLAYSPAYAASKGGVVNLTRTLGGEWGELGIRVNAIAPSHARTGIGGGFFKSDTESAKALQSAVESRTPLDRIPDPEELKGTALFLASDASSYCTGYTYAADGGWLASK